MPSTRARRTVHDLLFSETPGPLARRVHAAITALIVLNVAMVVAESVPSVHARWASLFFALEVVSVALFSVEYLLRLWSVVEDPRYAHPLLGRLRWAVSFFAIVDLLSILPFYLPHVVTDARFLRALRLARLIRSFRIGSQRSGMAMYLRVLEAKRGELMTALVMLLLLLVVASSAMYFVEHDAQPVAFSSIPAALWWGIVTMTTICYGDMYPMTAVGRILGGIVAVFGVAFFALPPAILVGGIMEELQKTRALEESGRAGAVHCPHCGGEISRPQG